MQTLLNTALGMAVEIMKADAGNIQLVTPQGGLKITAVIGFNEEWVEYWNRPESSGSCHVALQTKGRTIVRNTITSPVFNQESLAVQMSEKIYSCQSTPIVGQSGQFLGMLSTHYRRPWKDEWRSRFEILDPFLKLLGFVIEYRLGLSEKFSHELRTPLTSIMVHAYCLNKKVKDETLQASIRFIEQSVGKQEAAINDLVNNLLK